MSASPTRRLSFLQREVATTTTSVAGTNARQQVSIHRSRYDDNTNDKLSLARSINRRIIRITTIAICLCIVLVVLTQAVSNTQCHCQTILERHTMTTMISSTNSNTNDEQQKQQLLRQHYSTSSSDYLAASTRGTTSTRLARSSTYSVDSANSSSSNATGKKTKILVPNLTTKQTDISDIELQEKPVVIHESYDCSRLVPCSTLVLSNNFTMKKQCSVFYPLRFWRTSPLSTEFRPALHYQRIKRPQACYEQEMIMLTRRYDKIHPVDGDELPQPPSMCKDQLPDSMTYFHNFKTGGTTVFHTMAHQRVPFYNVTNDHKIFTQYLLNDYINDAPKMQRIAFDAIIDLEKRQQSDKSNDIIFTFTRSPVKRFLSGVAQIASMNLMYEVPSANRHCYESNATTTHGRIERIECIVSDIQHNGVFYNIHLYPQMYLFDSWTNWGLVDLKIVVMDMVDMDTLFQSLTGNVKRERRTEGQDQVSVSDLPESLLRSICELFKVDLIVLQLLGLDDGLCPKFIHTSQLSSQNASPSTTVA